MLVEPQKLSGFCSSLGFTFLVISLLPLSPQFSFFCFCFYFYFIVVGVPVHFPLAVFEISHVVHKADHSVSISEITDIVNGFFKLSQCKSVKVTSSPMSSVNSHFLLFVLVLDHSPTF